MKTLIYCRVSTREQGLSGLGLEAQREKCLAEIGARGWSLAPSSDRRPGIVIEVASASSRQRSELDRALRMLDSGAAEALMVSRLDRLSRSLGEFAGIMDRAEKHGWKIVVLDPPVDMSNPFGRMMAQVAMAFAELERHLISVRTKEGLAVVRAQNGGRRVGGVPRYSDEATIKRIVRFRRDREMTPFAIARWLTEAEVPSPNGVGHWNHKTVRTILDREGIA